LVEHFGKRVSTSICSIAQQTIAPRVKPRLRASASNSRLVSIETPFERTTIVDGFLRFVACWWFVAHRQFDAM
jgi:hypothetical protein